MRHVVELSPECWRVLAQLRAGGGLEGRRIFPHAHHFHLKRSAGGEYAAPLALATVDSLLHHKLLCALPVDRKADRIRYELTDFGKDTAMRGELVYDDENLDWTDAA